MIDAHMELYRETDMDIVKIMQDYPYPISGNITCADDWYHIQVKGTDSEEFQKIFKEKKDKNNPAFHSSNRNLLCGSVHFYE